MKLNGKVAVVTAATSGMGLEIAQTFAREGGRVVVADLNLPQAQAAAEEIGKVGPKAMGVAMDVADELAQRRDCCHHIRVRHHRRARQQRRHPDRAAARGFPLQRPVAGRKPRLVHAIDRSRASHPPRPYLHGAIVAQPPLEHPTTLERWSIRDRFQPRCPSRPKRTRGTSPVAPCMRALPISRSHRAR